MTRQQFYGMPTGSVIIRFGLSYPRIFIKSSAKEITGTASDCFQKRSKTHDRPHDRFLRIARRHQLFRADNPVQYRHLAITEMQQYAGQLKSHPAYHRFCDKFHLDYDEFIDNILQQAIKQLLPV